MLEFRCVAAAQRSRAACARPVARLRWPLIMVTLSLSGVLSVFGQVPVAWVAWVGGLVLTYGLRMSITEVHGAAWLPERNAFHIRGSWVPVTLIVAVFF